MRILVAGLAVVQFWIAPMAVSAQPSGGRASGRSGGTRTSASFSGRQKQGTAPQRTAGGRWTNTRTRTGSTPKMAGSFAPKTRSTTSSTQTATPSTQSLSTSSSSSRQSPFAGRTNSQTSFAGRAKSQSPPTGSRMSTTQQQNVQQLQSDANAIKQGSQVTQAQKDALKNDLNSMAKGASCPDPALTEQLTNDLSQAMAESQLSGKEKAKLMGDVEAVMNSANISKAQVNQAIADAQAILTASGISQAQAQAIVNDLKAIAAEAQKNAAGATAGTQGSGPLGRLRQRRGGSR
jgi:hypothetical protein